MKRIFAAVDISDRTRRQTSVYIEAMKNEFANVRAGWERPEKLHLTLKFLGETNEDQLTELENICREIAGKVPKFVLKIAETGVFPSPANARVLWIDVKDETESLGKINRMLEMGCEKIGFPAEKRKFKPHLTIARLKEPRNSRDLVKTHLEKNFEPVESEVAEIVIYQSRLRPTGSIYEKITTFQLKN